MGITQYPGGRELPEFALDENTSFIINLISLLLEVKEREAVPIGRADPGAWLAAAEEAIVNAPALAHCVARSAFF